MKEKLVLPIFVVLFTSFIVPQWDAMSKINIDKGEESQIKSVAVNPVSALRAHDEKIDLNNLNQRKRSILPRKFRNL